MIRTNKDKNFQRKDIMRSKESVDLRSLRKHGAVPFTSEDRYFKQLLDDCEQKNIKVRIERFPSFVMVVKK